MIDETAMWYNLEQKAYTIRRIENLDFPWKLQLPRYRCIVGGCAPRSPCTSGDCAPQTPSTLAAALPNHCIGGCAQKALKWLRHSIRIQSVTHCNEVAKPLQVWGAQPLSAGIRRRSFKVQRLRERSHPRCNESKGRSLPGCKRVWGAAAPQEKSKFSI